MATYEEAGVNIEAGEEAVRRIAPLVRATYTEGVLGDIGVFGGFFELGQRRYKNPVLVSSIDGVGTKVKVAQMMHRYDTVGQDLVNHCVNDIAVSGAKPLFFLDYFATGSLDPKVLVSIISGFSKACIENECALIGGETAEMPDIYGGEDFDLAGTVVGVVEKDRVLGASRVRAGDTLVGLKSTGLHTNGYTLARKVLLSKHDLHDRPDVLSGESIGETLLCVHRSYLRAIDSILDQAHAFVHVTGGGLLGNTQRVVKEPCVPCFDFGTWETPSIFRMIQRIGNVPGRGYASYI